MIVVRVEHIRQAKICMSGARAWGERQGWSWSDFLENGKSIEEVEATGDAFALRIARVARLQQTNTLGSA